MGEIELRVVQAWLAAARDLGIRVVAPFVLELEGREREYIAFLPDFSHPKGILVTTFSLPFDPSASDDACKGGYGCSLVNPELYCTYDRQHFIDTLVEWGFTGSPDARPSWMAPVRHDE